MGSSTPLFTSSPPQPTDTASNAPHKLISTLNGYTFPRDKLKRRLKQANKTPLVLVACGSFSPITTLHLQLFELAERHVERTEFEIVGNYISPCSDAYGKSSLVSAHHRINMQVAPPSRSAAEKFPVIANDLPENRCALAIEERRSNTMIDEWEALRRDSSGRPLYTCTADVLKRLDEQVNDALGGVQTLDGVPVRARVMLLIGADLALTMGDPTVWAPSDIDVLLGHYGAFVVERPTQCDVQQAIEPLKKYHDNIWVVPSFQNDVSSTKVRAQIQNGESVMDLPGSVLEYIKLHHLYREGSL